jgi:hypothetical protein
VADMIPTVPTEFWWLDGLFRSSEIWVEFYTEKHVMFCQTLCLHDTKQTN